MTLRKIVAHAACASALFSFAIIIPSSTRSQASPTSQTFEARFSQDYFVVPSGVTQLTVDMGAGSDHWGAISGVPNGLGGRVVVDITVTPGEMLEVLVGTRGDYNSGTGGWPDGGAGGGQVSVANASGGGGSTSIRAGVNGPTIAIAGGGGGGTNFTIGGAGGFPWGQDAQNGYTGLGVMDGKGATQSAGGVGGCLYDGTCPAYTNGSLHQGGESPYGGGGGGGYYGGGAGGGGFDQNNDIYSPSGGGGSSWVDPTRVASGTQPYYQPGFFPSNPAHWRNGNGYITLTWTPAVTTTTATTTTTTTTSSSTSTSTTITTVMTTTAPTTTTTVAPTWTSQPEEEREEPVVGRTPFPSSGRGSVVVVNEGGYVINTRNVFTPRWRTRVYIGSFKFAVRATYTVKKKKRTYTCTFPPFGTEKKVASSRKWRWYSPPRGCTLPKDLVTQLANGKTTMQFTGSFTRKWATSGKSTRPDGSRITPLRISLVIAGSESVALN